MIDLSFLSIRRFNTESAFAINRRLNLASIEDTKYDWISGDALQRRLTREETSGEYCHRCGARIRVYPWPFKSDARFGLCKKCQDSMLADYSVYTFPESIDIYNQDDNPTPSWTVKDRTRNILDFLESCV